MGSRLILLLDTHTLLWWFNLDRRLSATAKETLTVSGNIVYVSAAAAWEIAIKTTAGRLDAQALLSDFPRIIFRNGFRRLAISTAHAILAAQLPAHHKDPFDRMLAAQAQAVNCSIVSADPIFDRYGVERIW